MFFSNMSRQTRRNWWLDAVLFGSGMIAILSGIYFLFLPFGGYRGGRNPNYGLQILFTRQTWDDLHTWGGVAMIVAAALHLVLHWSWFVSMGRQMGKALIGKSGRMNSRARWNLVLNLVVGISFLLTTLSGIYFLFFPGGHGTPDPLILFTHVTWDLIHTWAGIAFIAGAVIHFAIHWKWVARVTCKLFKRSRPSAQVSQPVPATNS